MSVSNKTYVLTATAVLFIASATLRVMAETASVDDPKEGSDEHIRIESHPSEAKIEDRIFGILQREKELTIREQNLDSQKGALELANTLLEKKLKDLEESERKLAATISRAASQSEKDIGQLASVYQEMEPEKSAGLFSAMDPSFAAGFLAQMNSEAAALIFDRLPSETAYNISVILANRNIDTPTE